jgi:hypothetical protein
MDATKHARFEQNLLPHLDAGYNLARWLTRDRDPGLSPGFTSV